MESGEGMDRATLSLTGAQEALLRAVAATDTPIITVFIQGRPLDMTLASELSDALLTAWYPGERGGAALASVLLGDANPSGRLPLSVPRDAGQLPVYYQQGRVNDYADMPVLLSILLDTAWAIPHSPMIPLRFRPASVTSVWWVFRS